MALCHALSILREKLDFQLIALSLDHGLRPEAAAEVSLVEHFCAEHRVPFARRRLDLHDGSNLQERARTARYAALGEMARDHYGTEAFIATAHHKQDRAETVLLRLLRGTSLEALAVLPPRSKMIIRPMIRATRQDVEVHLQRHRVPSSTDPSNADARFLRARVRHELLPLLTELGAGIVDHLVELADEAEKLPEPLGLNREQRRQIRQALQDRRIPVNLRLPGGLLFSRENRGKKSSE